VKMNRVITIVSGKGGTGKTTTAINLGAALNQLDKEVIIVDANLNTPNIGIHLGAPVVPINLNHVLKGKANIHDAVYEHASGMKIVLSALSVQEFNTKKLPEIISKLRKISDFVIIDAAAGFGEELIDTIRASDEIIIVTNPEMLAVTDALKTIKVARGMGKNVRGAIVTRTQGKEFEMSFPSIKSMLETPIIGIVPEDDSIKKSLAQKDAVIHTHPKSKASKRYHEIARKISGHKTEKKNFWQKIKTWDKSVASIFG
jgi:septum site-determining protein MinD